MPSNYKLIKYSSHNTTRSPLAQGVRQHRSVPKAHVRASITTAATPSAAHSALQITQAPQLATSPTKPKHKQEATSTPETAPSAKRQYKYVVLKGNNSNLVRDALMRRPWWTPTVDHDTQFNFKWKQTCHDLHYHLLNRDSANKQMVNHFEFNRELTTKPGLLRYDSQISSYPFDIDGIRNLMAYMERKDLNVFDVMPVTFFIKPGGLPQENELQEFIAYFNQLAARNAKIKEIAKKKQPTEAHEGSGENDIASAEADDETVSSVDKHSLKRTLTKSSPQKPIPAAAVQDCNNGILVSPYT